ncbi:general secretion pathway protein GspB [Vibrio sp. SCSIO 43137]|uniref:general secretion pathway protein GspB n=1 Tax=Vibrio sp. SCSIO 43137 TaxID=3021011 RepID=UPI002306F68C|nr:general secretion pathway protein GspB [Vibrio sp. SCSIO 43137]WCE29310.1 general secretion pathway protein GspB [Vibrio sp. SCSIO 43137]
MSQIMKALEQSEQSHQASFNRISSTGTVTGAESQQRSWLVYLLAGGILPLIVLLYVILDTSRQWQTEKALIVAQQEEMTAQSETEVAKLAYPELAELRSLSEIRKDLSLTQPVVEIAVSQTSNPEPQPVKNEKPGEITEQPLDLNSLDLSGLSPELAQRVQSAFGEQDDGRAVEKEPTIETVKLTDDTSRYRGVLPAMNLQTHMYASSKDRRWVKINGEELYEGDWLNNQIQLIAVEPRTIVIEYNRERIEIPALYEWNG